VENAALKNCVLSSFLNMAGLTAARMSGSSDFHAAGLGCEKARSPNLVHSRGITYLLLEADHRPVSAAALLHIQTMSLRYAGHLPVCIPYMIAHSLKSIRQQIGSHCSTIRLGVTRLRTSSCSMRHAGHAAVVRELTARRWLILHYSSLAST